MKLLKRTLLAVGGVLVVGSFGLMFVSASTSLKSISTDLSNAVHHFDKIKVISSEKNNKTSAEIQYVGSGLLEINTNNFVLSHSDANPNEINKGKGLSILGGVGNKIGASSSNEYSVILGGENNTVGSNYATIIGGSDNINNGKYATILGGKRNVVRGESSVIVGGENNNVSGSLSVALGDSNAVNGNSSVGMGLYSKVDGNDSFLWNVEDPGFEVGSGIFAVNGEHGMVINTGKAYSFANLTVGGPMIISGTMAPECSLDSKGVVKIVNDGSGKCLCSCDGEYWNSIIGGKCVGVCNTMNLPECGNEVVKNYYTVPYSYAGSCEKGKVVGGTGAYLVGQNGIIHWSCESDDGTVVACEGMLPENGLGDNILTGGFECNGVLPENAVAFSAKPTNGATWYTYNEIPGTACEYKCNPGYFYVEGWNSCNEAVHGACGDPGEIWECKAGYLSGNVKDGCEYRWICEGIGGAGSDWCRDTDEACIINSGDVQKIAYLSPDLHDMIGRGVLSEGEYPQASLDSVEKIRRINGIGGWNEWRLISTADSPVPIYAQRGGNYGEEIYYFTEADIIYLPENSSYMFSDMRGLESIDMRGWDTSKVKNMSHMFKGCSNLRDLDLSSWDTRNVERIDYMFYNCTKLESLDVSSWNTSGVVDMWGVFMNCVSLKNLDVSNWNVSRVDTMGNMFHNCMSLTSLDLSRRDTSNVRYMDQMFLNAKNLETIYACAGFKVDNVETSNVLFWGNLKLVGGAGTRGEDCDLGVSDCGGVNYAHIDGGWSNPGYFTASGSNCGTYVGGGNGPCSQGEGLYTYIRTIIKGGILWWHWYEYEWGQECGICGKGYYCPNGRDRVRCPAGTYNGQEGKVHKSDCLPCPNGKYSVEGASSCSNSCPDGYLPVESSHACVR